MKVGQIVMIRQDDGTFAPDVTGLVVEHVHRSRTFTVEYLDRSTGRLIDGVFMKDDLRKVETP